MMKMMTKNRPDHINDTKANLTSKKNKMNRRDTKSKKNNMTRRTKRKDKRAKSLGRVKERGLED